MTWRSGKDIYKGYWANDQRAKGTMWMYDGTIYEGEWKNDVFHGKGSITFRPDRKGQKGVIY